MSKTNPTPQEKYAEKNCINFCLKLNRKTDADVIGWLEQQPSKQGAVKALIRQVIAGGSAAVEIDPAIIELARRIVSIYG